MFLANNPESSWTAQEIAERTQVPADYLSKIMRTMGRARLVRSRPGRNGGYELMRDPGDVTLLEITDAVEPLRIVDKCPLGDPCHVVELCPLHRALRSATAEFARSLAATSLASLCTQGTDREVASASRGTGRGRS